MDFHIITAECRDIIKQAPDRLGANDRLIEVWAGNRWVRGWWSWVRPGMVFRFVDSTILTEDQCFVAESRTHISYANRSADPTLSMGVVRVLQAPSQKELYEAAQEVLEAPKSRPRLTYDPDDVQDV